MHFKWIELKFTKIIRKCKPKCFKTLMVVSLFIASVTFATNDAIRNSQNSILVSQDIMVGIAIHVEKKPPANLCNFGFYFQNKNKSKELVKNWSARIENWVLRIRMRSEYAICLQRLKRSSFSSSGNIDWEEKWKTCAQKCRI